MRLSEVAKAPEGVKHTLKPVPSSQQAILYPGWTSAASVRNKRES